MFIPSHAIHNLRTAGDHLLLDIWWNSITDLRCPHQYFRQIHCKWHFVQQAVQLLKKFSPVMAFLSLFMDSSETIERWCLQHSQRIKEVINHPLLGGENDGLEDMSKMEPAVWVPQHQLLLLFQGGMIHEESNTEVCNVSDSSKDKANMEIELVGSKQRRKTNHNAEKAKKEVDVTATSWPTV